MAPDDDRARVVREQVKPSRACVRIAASMAGPDRRLCAHRHHRRGDQFLE
jgi:hypothetical protein